MKLGEMLRRESETKKAEVRAEIGKAEVAGT
jgi:hypothetical protein